MKWDMEAFNDFTIERWMVQHPEHKGFKGLPFHFERIRNLLWPKLDSHRWHVLTRDEILRPKTGKSKVTVLMGAASTGKSHAPSWIRLVEYFCFPDETCVLISSITISGLKKRIWAEITMLWEQAVAAYPDDIPGHLLDSAIAITTDSLEDVEYGERKSRDMRKGIFGIACVVGNKTVGLSRYQGIKQKRMRVVADEAAAMSEGFLSAFSNLSKNEDFEAEILGNPSDPSDPLGRAAEPKEGWTDEYMEPKKTVVWDTRFYNGRCINLIGTDSPNFDFPADQPTRYKYLISKEGIEETLTSYPKDSFEYYSMCIGSMKIGTMARRILTRKMCDEGRASDPVIWKDENRTKIYFVDSAYGGDRCVGGMGEFGLDVHDKIILAFDQPKIIPIVVGGAEPEYQIANFVKEDCERLGVIPSNMGHDSTGRGSLGTALGKVWNSHDTNPVESGGKPTERPVSLDMYITDEETSIRRLKRCDEHYDRKVTEFWYTMRYAVEASQIRQLPGECLEELCLRQWDRIKEKINIEPKSGTPTRPGMKERVGKSPDFGDWACGILEMARRKGFHVAKLASPVAKSKHPTGTLHRKAADLQALLKEKRLAMAH